MGSSSSKLHTFHQAVGKDDYVRVGELLKDEDIDPNQRSDRGLTALHLAIASGSTRSVEVLLASGRVDLVLNTPARETPLILAVRSGREELALFLLKRIPDKTLQISAMDMQGLTAIHHACIQGLGSVLETLLARGVNCDAPSGKLRHTPLMLAAQNGHESLVTLLLEAGAKPCAVDIAKMTALHHSCLASSEECVRVLLASGSKDAIDAADMSGCTPLLYTLNNKDASVERLLVSNGASLTKALDAGFSELCYHTYTDS